MITVLLSHAYERRTAAPRDLCFGPAVGMGGITEMATSAAGYSQTQGDMRLRVAMVRQ